MNLIRISHDLIKKLVENNYQLRISIILIVMCYMHDANKKTIKNKFLLMFWTESYLFVKI